MSKVELSDVRSSIGNFLLFGELDDCEEAKKCRGKGDSGRENYHLVEPHYTSANNMRYIL